MTKFTAEQLTEWAGLGPWVRCMGPYADVRNGNNQKIAGTMYAVHKGDKDKYEARVQECRANAALIAAAPDLAAALLAKEAEVEELRAALQKAEIEREYWRGCAVLTKDHVGGFQKRLQDWINEGELMQGKNNVGT